MSASVAPAKFLEGMRLTEHERAVLIEQMKKSGAVERRKNPRLIVDGNVAMLVAMDSPGGASACFRIYPWDISRGGVGFFHRSFVYPGTRCTFTGATFTGAPYSITGEVVRCSHVSGQAHAVGVQLDSEIDPEELLGPQFVRPAGGPVGLPAVDDWWSKFGGFAAELARLARDKAPPEAIRACVAGMSMHACSPPNASHRADSPKAGA